MNIPTDPFLPLIRSYIFPNDRHSTVTELYLRLVHAMNERDNRPLSVLIDAGIRLSWISKTNPSVNLIERIFETVSFELGRLLSKTAPAQLSGWEAGYAVISRYVSNGYVDSYKMSYHNRIGAFTAISM